MMPQSLYSVHNVTLLGSSNAYVPFPNSVPFTQSKGGREKSTCLSILSRISSHVAGMSETAFSDFWTNLGARRVLEDVLAKAERTGRNARHRDWSGLYYRHLEAGDTLQVHELVSDFESAATAYARILIQEYALPESSKTIRHGTGDNRAKYEAGGILLELAEDREVNGQLSSGAPCPDLEVANKVLGVGLQAAIAFAGVLDEGPVPVRLPLQALVDLWGFRVLATAMPLENSKFVLGSRNEGVTMHDDDFVFKSFMEEAGRMLHLAPHTVLGHTMFTSADVNGSVFPDGSRYLTSLSRALPPEYPLPHLPAAPQSHLWRRIRPEYLQSLAQDRRPPLSSDALTLWGVEGCELLNGHVRDASLQLTEAVIPRCAAELCPRYANKTLSWDDFATLRRDLQREGINIRHLGLLRSLVKSPGTQKLLLLDMMRRTMKNALRAVVRQCVMQKGGPQQVLVAICDFLLVLNSPTDKFWGSLATDIRARFGTAAVSDRALSADYLSPFIPELVLYLLASVGMSLTPASAACLRAQPLGTALAPSDLIVVPEVKSLQTATVARAVSLALRSTLPCSSRDNTRRLVSQAFTLAKSVELTRSVSRKMFCKLMELRHRELDSVAGTAPVVELLGAAEIDLILQEQMLLGSVFWNMETALGFLAGADRLYLFQQLLSPLANLAPFESRLLSSEDLVPEIARSLMLNMRIREAYVNDCIPVQLIRTSTSLNFSNKRYRDSDAAILAFLIKDVASQFWFPENQMPRNFLLRKRCTYRGCMCEEERQDVIKEDGMKICMCGHFFSLHEQSNGLREIDMRNNRSIGLNGARLLADSAMDRFKPLELLSGIPFARLLVGDVFALDLTGTNSGLTEACVLSSILKTNRSLKSLRLERNELEDAGAMELSEGLKLNESLEVLSLYSNGIKGTGARAIGSALKVNCSLTSLNLFGNRLGVEGAQALSSGLKENRGLLSLTLSDADLRDSGAAALGEMLQVNSTLTSLNIRGNKFTEEGATYLGAALRVNTALRELDLSNNKLGASGARAMAAGLKENGVLESLNLSATLISNEGAQAYSEAFAKNQTLRELSLANNEIAAEGGQALARLLESNSVLRRLDLTTNSLGPAGTAAFATMFQLNKGLEELSLKSNLIGEAAALLAEGLKANATLKELNLQDNGIEAKAAMVLGDSLQTNVALLQLDLRYNDLGGTNKLFGKGGPLRHTKGRLLYTKSRGSESGDAVRFVVESKTPPGSPSRSPRRSLTLRAPSSPAEEKTKRKALPSKRSESTAGRPHGKPTTHGRSHSTGQRRDS